MDRLLTIALVMFGILGSVAVVAGLSLLIAFPVMWCWNYTMPYLFELKEISWGQAWCLNFICHLLIKSSQTNNSK